MTEQEKTERGNRLKSVLKYRHTTQTALAEKLIMTQTNMNKICNGKTALTDSRAQECARILDINADYLMLKSDFMTNEQKQDQRKATIHDLEDKRDNAMSDMFDIQNEAAKHYFQFLETLFGIKVDVWNDEADTGKVYTSALIPLANMPLVTLLPHTDSEGEQIRIDPDQFESFLRDTWEYINLRLEKLLKSKHKSLSLAESAADLFADSNLKQFILKSDIKIEEYSQFGSQKSENL